MSEEIVIVSGLPRSGTSMMMQMIHSGGIPVMTDELRKADSNNPEGYYEYEPVKKLASDNSWMDEARGKCIKVIAQLIPYIKEGLRYKVIFMNRPVDEVLRSQQILLGKDPLTVNPVLSDVFNKQVKSVFEWMDSRSWIEYKVINYFDVISDPVDTANEISSFIGKELDVKKMIQAVKPDLYRNKV